MLITNDFLIQLSKFEGFRPSVYTCPAGYKTIGFGHVLKANENYFNLTRSQAFDLLKSDVDKFANQVENDFYMSQLNDHQRLALVDFAFNLGFTYLKKSALYRYIIIYVKNQSSFNLNQVADKFLIYYKYRKNGVLTPSKGLLKRRQYERTLFIS